MTALGARLADYASLVKLAHTAFALPFALLSLLVATAGRPPLRLWAPCLLAVLAARTAAMAWNRYVDRDVDAQNPRTAGREIPRGVVSPQAARHLALGSAAVFLAVCGWIGPRSGVAAVPVLAWLLAYSHIKRISSLCHLWLGVALALAPVASWVAARDVIGNVAVPIGVPLVLAAGVAAWVAGFDVLYACQDEAFDRAAGLHSIPARLGARRALWVARGLHLLAAVLFAGFGYLAGLGYGYAVGTLLATGVLLWQHRALTAAGVATLRPGFFLQNGLLSVAMLVCGAVDVYLVPAV